MAEPPKKRRIFALVIVAAAIALGYFVRDCGFGTGLTGSSGPSSGAASPAKGPTQEVPPTPGAPLGPVNVLVRGDRCIVDGAAPELCTTACENIARRSTPETPINVDAGAGQQAAVDGLRACLGTKGYRAVRIDSETLGGKP